ncbi:uncharacterized protein LOC120255724 isoform X2 [Dioscorea cayenensis subsp. rotundata]|uniref:Uncharacterized protein LOC120255724 isoform X2 n=1 Tax=Dioscorea cayennensis subsp. rotundata TaxID=55577 RepID=A0AB40AXG9_DIOCR|nr:uncharacterized protein LOC120255724 isoform X2 [Dioscorea cayenensis subsp. rotundata]
MATAPPLETPSSDVFSLRIVYMDYYMAAPIPDLDFSKGSRVSFSYKNSWFHSCWSEGMHARPWVASNQEYRDTGFVHIFL